MEIVECLRTNTQPIYTAPEPGQVTGDTAEARALSAEKEKLIFHEKFKWFMRKQEEFKVNFSKAFATIWETYCSAEVKREIKEMPDWDLGADKIRDNSLKYY